MIQNDVKEAADVLEEAAKRGEISIEDMAEILRRVLIHMPKEQCDNPAL